MLYARKDWSMLRRIVFGGASGGGLTEYTATGNPATFSTNVAKPLKQLLIPFTPVQSGSGDPSPENVRTITGWTGLTAYRTGKNLFDKNNANVLNCYINQNQIISSSSHKTVYIPCKPNTTYSISNSENNRVSCCDTSDVPQAGSVGGSYSSTGKITTSGNAKYLVVYCWNKSVDVATFEDVLDALQIEVGDATAYAPYTGQSYPVTFPAEAGTVYGGSLDLTTGVLTVEWAFVDMGTLEYSLDGETATRQTWRFNVDIYQQPTSDNTLYAMCSEFKQAKRTDVWSPYSMSFTISGAKMISIINFSPSTYADKNEVKTAMDGIKLCYKLAEPQTIQLTPTEITALVGDNVIWADTNGENTIKYLKKG